MSFYARAGEITGIAGLVGCGKSEIVRAVYGLEAIASGSIRVEGRGIAARPTPIDMLRRGVCYFPSDRVAEGLALGRPVRENVSMAALDLPAFSRARVLRRASERRAIQGIVDKLKLRPPQIERTVAKLSGGNRQKVLLARGMTRDISVFLFDEPTVGIDVGAKIEVYELMKIIGGGGRGHRPGVLGTARGDELVESALRDASLADGGRTFREPISTKPSYFAFLPRGGRRRARARAARWQCDDERPRTVSSAAPNVALDKFYRLYGAVGFLPIMLVGLIVAVRDLRAAFSRLAERSECAAQSSYLVILAVGQMLVLIVGGFDLSVGAVVAADQRVERAGHGRAQGAMADYPARSSSGVLTGLGCGLLSAWSTAFAWPFACLAVHGDARHGSIATGLALLLTNGIPVYGMPAGYVDGLGRALAGVAERRLSRRSRSSAWSGACRTSREWAAISMLSAAICRPPRLWRCDAILSCGDLCALLGFRFDQSVLR